VYEQFTNSAWQIDEMKEEWNSCNLLKHQIFLQFYWKAWTLIIY